MTQILFPVGRMIGGSVYQLMPVVDKAGRPKIGKDGKPMKKCSIGHAIKKNGEQHWSQTPWGQQVMQVGASAFPQNYQGRDFAWKIKDGDSREPNKVGKIIAEQEGCAGHWVIWFSQSWLPKLVTDKGALQLIEPEAIMPGYYVEILADCFGNNINGPTESPGVYLNPLAVNRVAYGERIQTASVDTTSVGFGQGALPTGASLTPIGGGFAPAPMAQQVQQAPAWPPVGQAPAQVHVAPQIPVQQAPAWPPVGQAPAQVHVAPQIPVMPNPAFLTIPAVPAAPPAPPVRQMTAKAAGTTYETFIANKWTDELLVQHGYMVR